jgi:HAD superfamily, subfamily IIIB (Acid phosphatase)
VTTAILAGSCRRLLVEAAAVGLAVSMLACGNSSATTTTEPKAPASPEGIVSYRDSGQWERDISRVTAAAREHLERRLATGIRRPALVLDIDDTSLSSYDCLKERDFKRSPDSPCARGGDLPVIPQTLELYTYARQRGVTVLFLTGRRERLRRATVTNLRAAGYSGRLRLRMRPNRERRGTHDGFKARERRRLERRGFTIVANVGDQRSDLDGGAALRTFKLPNPMYVIADA